jgi:hypothetical protein
MGGMAGGLPWFSCPGGFASGGMGGSPGVCVFGLDWLLLRGIKIPFGNIKTLSS